MQHAWIHRRRIGPTYEKTPAEQATLWIMDNALRLLSTVIACFLFCLAVDWIACDLLNFLASNGKEGVADAYSGTDPVYAGFKICGSFVIGYWLLFRLSTKARF